MYYFLNSYSLEADWLHWLFHIECQNEWDAGLGIHTLILIVPTILEALSYGWSFNQCTFFLRGGEEGQREKVRENLKEVPPPVQSPMWGLIS